VANPIFLPTMKLIFSLLGCIFWVNIGWGQHTSSDSLRRFLGSSMPDSLKVKQLDQVARANMYTNATLALEYAQAGLTLARKNNDPKGMVRLLNRLGVIQRIKGQYPQALKTYLEAIEMAEKYQDWDGVVRVSSSLGVLYSEQKDHKKALEYYYKVKNIAQSLSDSSLQQILLINIGTSYAMLNQLDSAEFYTKQAYQMTLSYNMGNSNVLLRNLGNILYRKKQYPEAMEYYRRSLNFGNNLNNGYLISQIYLEMAYLFREMKSKDSCLYYAQKSYNTAQKAQNLKYILDSSQLLAELYESQNKALAYDYLKVAAAMRDTLYNQEQVKQTQTIAFNEQIRKNELEDAEKEFKNRQRLGILASILAITVVVMAGLYRQNILKQRANRLLANQKAEILTQKAKVESTLVELRATQAQLIQSEKLASLGELTAGIAHEIQNPLNFVNNFSELSVELISELLEERNKEHGERDEELEKDLLNDLVQNQEKINHHGKRASSIVKGMLEHSRASTGERALTDINKLADEYLRLSYHGIRAKDNTFNSDYKTDFDEKLPKIEVIPQDIGRVLLNIINNAFYAVGKKEGGKVIVSTKKLESGIEIKVTDNGIGMSEVTKAKIFQPFFTTKPTGQGTGLGLSLAYDIITKGHGGSIEVETVEGEGTTFIIKLPYQTKQNESPAL
jgi:two-component system, NtrC family, sensor kinase